MRSFIHTFVAGAATLSGALALPTGAWAQCTDNSNTASIINGVLLPLQNLYPLGAGSSLSAVTATVNSINTAFLSTTSAFVSAPAGAPANSFGWGTWGRSVGGESEFKTTSTGTVNDVGGVIAAALGTPVVGQQNCRTTVEQSYVGHQFGADVSVLNMYGMGANWHFGAMGGYLTARTNDRTPGTTFTNLVSTFTIPDSQFAESTDVPYVGLYTTFTYRNFYVDAQARWDFYRNRISDPLGFNGGIKFDGQGFSLTSNAGYNIPLGSGWFIEPSGGVIWSNVAIDTINVASYPAGLGPLSGNVKIGDVESLLGRASVRIGTNFAHGGIGYQPYFTYSLFHEFEGDVTATSTITSVNCGNCNGTQLISTSKGGVGTYSQFGLGTAMILDKNVVTYVRGDYKVGDHLEGWAVTAGIRFSFGEEGRPLK